MSFPDYGHDKRLAKKFGNFQALKQNNSKSACFWRLFRSKNFCFIIIGHKNMIISSPKSDSCETGAILNFNLL